MKNKKKYNEKNKNRIRELIVNSIREKKVNSILTLESPRFLFSKLLPDKKIIVWENDSKTYKKLEKEQPKNVDLVFGDISKFGRVGKNVDVVYLDFCRTFETEEENIVALKEKLENSKLFILTVCMRSNSKLETRYRGDYQFHILSKIQTLTEVNWKVIYGESYYDSVQMVTIIMENPNA